ncbi:dihydroorotase, mitochondrial-like [Tripterygium wilfordii]|uniref:dihydroorotase, mitochondrial-like n=1 Tax=Tripterygium wilfordii TaxID=458696 RepID=UPI0018F7F19B|nr:dihydroorotase, mitochondrial-like [Tripterygium wilfordii]
MEDITTMDVVRFVESCKKGLAIVSTMNRGSKRFFLGTDSAPQKRQRKECPCGCAGIYNAHVALCLHTEIFKEAGALDKQKEFTSFSNQSFMPYQEIHQRELWWTYK